MQGPEHPSHMRGNDVVNHHVTKGGKSSKECVMKVDHDAGI